MELPPIGSGKPVRTFIVLIVLMVALPAQAHSREELDEWVVEWVLRADDTLSAALFEEWRDMRERHPYYFDPQPVSVSRSSSSRTWSGNVEQWRSLIETFFPSSQVETAMRILSCETGGTGNPNAYNDRSGASGLFQHLPKYWQSRSSKAGYAGADIMDPVANVAVAAWLARDSWFHWTCY